MRWFIVFLIVANIILFVWVKQQSRTSPDSTALPPPDIGRLRLSSEVEEESRTADPSQSSEKVEAHDRSMPDSPAESALDDAGPVPLTPLQTSPEPAVAMEPLSEDSEVDTVKEVPKDEQQAEGVPAVVQPAAQDESVAEDESIAADPVDVEPDAPVPEPQQAAVAPVDALPIEVLPSPVVAESVDAASGPGDNESAQGGAAESGPQQDPVPQPVTEAEPVDEEPAAVPEDVAPQAPLANCARVGPFEPADADRMVSSLPADTELLSDVSEEYSRVDRYYVLVPPLPSRTEGRRMLKRLAEAGFTDTWLFPSGEYRNAISLGYFSRESGARRHAANIAKKGFETEVREKATVRQRRWLLLRKSGGEEPGSGLKLPKGVGAEPQACP